MRISRKTTAWAVLLVSLASASDAIASMRIGGAAGVTASKLTQQSESGSALNAPTASLLIFVPVSRWLWLGTEPAVFRKGMTVNYSRVGDVDVHATALEVPLIVRTSWPSGNGPFAELGATIGFSLSSRCNNPEYVPDVGRFRNPTFGFLAGAGLEWRLNDRWGALLGAQLWRDLSTSYENAEFDPYGDGSRARAFRVRIGFLYDRPR